MHFQAKSESEKQSFGTANLAKTLPTTWHDREKQARALPV